MTLHAKIPIPDLQQHPWNLNLIKNVVHNVVENCLIPISSPLFLISNKCASHFCYKTTNGNEQKHDYLIHTWSYKAFEGIAIFALRNTLNTLKGLLSKKRFPGRALFCDIATSSFQLICSWWVFIYHIFIYKSIYKIKYF